MSEDNFDAVVPSKAKEIDLEYTAKEDEVSLTSEQKYKLIISEILHRKRRFYDNDDVPSKDPSYSKVDWPYEMKCKLRYQQKRAQYEKQFQYEISQLMSLQASAYEAARFHRHLAITSLWPPYHNHEEIKFTAEKIFRLPKKKQKRLYYLMNTTIT